MLSLLRKNPDVIPTLEDTVLVVLHFLRREGIERISESELHRLVFAIGSLIPAPLKFIQRPTTFSNELYQSLKTLERGRLVDELIYVHDGWVPKHLYELTPVGRLRAHDLEDRIRTFRALPIEDLLDAVIVAARSRQLLPKLNK